MTSSYVRESDVPRHFNISYDENKIPQRELRDFTVTRGGEKVSICLLDDGVQRGPPMIARGTVTSKSNKTIRVESAALIEWCIEYSVNVTPTLWIRTNNVWYKLTRPSKEYARTHELARRRYELCSRIYILLTTTNPNQCTFSAITLLLAQNYMEMKSYSEREILMEKDFILSQFEMLGDPSINGTPFMKDLSRMGGGVSKKAGRSRSASRSRSESRSRSRSPVGRRSGSALRGEPGRRGDTGRNGHTSSDTVGKGSSYNSPGGTASPLVNGGEQGFGEWEESAMELDAEAKSRVMKKVEKALVVVMKNRLAHPFNQPVDPVHDECPDYLDRISDPMDYGTIKKRLESRKFYTGVAAVVHDVRQVTKNCIKYNTEEHIFSKWVLSLQQKFEAAVWAAEEAEASSGSRKQLTGSNGNIEGGNTKKRKVPGSDEAQGKGGAGKRGSKAGKKGARAAKDESPASAPPAAPADEENVTPDDRLCMRATYKACNRRAVGNSKYCSTECGLIVARERIEELKKKGHNPDVYVRTFVAKTIAHSRP